MLYFEITNNVLAELNKLKPEPIQELKCGSDFLECLKNSTLNVKAMKLDVVKENNLINFYGIPVVLDETLPANMARIGDKFIQLKL